MGRLGNQMFIIAATHSLAIDNGVLAVFSSRVNGVTPTGKESFVHRQTILRNVPYDEDLSFVKCVYRQDQNFSFSPIPYQDGVCLIGYFQSEKYFLHNRDEILKLFSPPKPLEDLICRKYSKIIGNNRYVSVHIRRGDYLLPKFSGHHTNLGREYYQKAMSHFPDDSTFVFFSDDIEWCKQTFGKKNSFFVENTNDVIDMYLMSKIPNNIIANSSFSWWGAWLNTNGDKKVIRPKNWFGPLNSHLITKDLTPEEWVVI